MSGKWRFDNQAGSRPEQREALQWMWSAGGRAGTGVIWLVVLQSVGAASGVVVTLILREVIDHAAAGERSAFLFTAVVLCVITVLQLALNAFIRWLRESVKAGTENSLKLRAYQTVLTRSYASLVPYHTGELLNRMTNDTVVIADGMATVLPNTVAMIVKMIGAAAVLMMLDVRFAVIFLVGGGAVLLVSYAVRRLLKQLHREVQESDGRVRSFLQETMENLIVLRSYGGEDTAAAMAGERMRDHKEIRMKRNHYSNVSNTGFGVFLNAGYLFGLIWCGFGILEGSISYGTLTAVLQLVGQIQSPFANVTGYIPKFYSMVASAERLMELEELPGESGYVRLTAAERDALYGKLESIEARGLTFTYPDMVNNPNILKNTDVSIEKGSFVAITGRSGIGKSTLLKLLMAVYPPEAGTLELRLDGEAPRPVSPATRALFAYVPQGNFLLSGSILEAVSFPEKEADPARVREACRIACAEFVQALPRGYDTVIGEKGAGLSEGQVQRLAIARALYSQAPILLLDEATSALDEGTETKLLHNIRALTDRTVLIVTHRRAALEVCDKVLVVRNGTLGFE